MITKEVTFSQFETAFSNAGHGDSFSNEGLHLLYDFLTCFAADTAADDLLDAEYLQVVYAEGSAQDVAKAYGIDSDDPQEIVDALEMLTSVAGLTKSGTIVYQQD